MEKELDLRDFGGGGVLLYHECYNSDGVEEIFMTVRDFEEDMRCTAIMEPHHARHLAQMLLDIADEAEHWNSVRRSAALAVSGRQESESM